MRPSFDNGEKWCVLAGLWGLYFCFGLGFTGIPPLVQPIQASLELSPTQVGHILGSWQFVYMFCAIPCAYFMVRKEPLFALTVAAILVLISLVLRVFAQDYRTLLLTVALLGAAGPIISIGCPYLVGQMFDQRFFGFAMGAYVTAPALANMLTFSLSEPVLLPAFSGNWRPVLLFWAGFAGLFVLFWLIIPKHVAKNRDELSSDAISIKGDRCFVATVCLVGILIFFVDHGYKSWLPEVVRHAGYSTAGVAALSTVSIGMWLLALLLVPMMIVDTRSYNQVVFLLSGLLIAGSVGIATLQIGPAFVMACLAVGFSIGPLMTIGLMPIVGRKGMTGAAKIFVMALFFTAAEIGGTLGPVFFGSTFDAHGNFDMAFWAFVVAAFLIPMLLIRPGKKLGQTQKAEESNA
ncbi:major Facilitator Superfamily protein [Roseovarius sp. A-2]|uniref:MFS transporter n=1 Tax=Roseovarius sp. A-2 TaxID=1570360 RepID=UPI0009B5120F|nr:MFS transporter [Roseovarius sp. A-2]GAW33644.1 major Facilitator Superfamily protein [Roseovarius sp. A-2]